MRGQLLALSVDVKDTSELPPVAPTRSRARELYLRSLPPFPFCLALENLSASAQYFVQRFLKVSRRAREVGTDLRDILLIALLDFVAEELLERTLFQSFCVLSRIIGNHVRYERSRQSLCPETRIARKERIDWSTSARSGLANDVWRR